VIAWPMARIRGQESFLLRSPTVELAITRLGGMLAPITFFPQDPDRIHPYAIAPWAEEALPAGIPAMLRALRGDWFCSAFGENAGPDGGYNLPPHGETANGEWYAIAGNETAHGTWLRLGIDLPKQAAHCESTTTLLQSHSVIYQRHDLSGLKGPCNPGHHATLQFPDRAGAGRLSFSRLIHAQTYIEPTELPVNRGYSCLEPDQVISDLASVHCVDGSTTDLSRFPARRGFEDIAILCADPSLEFAWSAVTFPQEGYVWFALRDPKQLASTLLWFSNGGRHFPPWNGRHVNVMGIEDITGFFHVGIEASYRANALSARGVRTSLEPNADGRISIPYIQGVARIPADFDRVASIQRQPEGDTISITAETGASVRTPCCVEFLVDGDPAGLESQ
jgi:hypothetical protein